MNSPKAPQTKSPAGQKRRRYEAPQVLSSEAFERLALSCSGTGPSPKNRAPCTVQFS